jgi:hypothetical protein
MMPVRFRGCGCCGLNAAQERICDFNEIYINIFQYILCCSRAVFYMLRGVLVGNCVADAAFALFAPNVYSESACFVPNEKCDIYSKAEENALREKQKVCILERQPRYYFSTKP